MGSTNTTGSDTGSTTTGGATTGDGARIVVVASTKTNSPGISKSRVYDIAGPAGAVLDVAYTNFGSHKATWVIPESGRLKKSIDIVDIGGGGGISLDMTHNGAVVFMDRWTTGGSSQPDGPSSL